MANPRGIDDIPARRGAVRRGSWRWRAALPAITALVLAPPVEAGQLRELVREATPLVLKDGRIAHVAIWAVPFRPGANDLNPEVRAELAGLVETLATDCFLTAQAIGHVEPEAAKAGESLAAHRLARARADRIQQAMVERGLQASAIASVWDWQFVVKEPRVTVWVFRLHEGEDCEGKRLERPAASAPPSPPGSRELPVRTATAPSPPERPAAERGTPPADPPARAAAAPTASGEAAAPMPGSTPPPRPIVGGRLPSPQQPAMSLPGASAAAEENLPASLRPEASAAASPPPATPVEPPRPGPATAPATAAPKISASEAKGTAPDAKPAASGPAPQPPASRPAEPAAKPLRTPAADTAVAAGTGAGPAAATKAEAAPTAPSSLPDPRPSSPAAESGQPTTLAAVDPQSAAGPTSVELVFDVNSSYLPKGAAAELRRFLKGLPPGGAVRLAIVGAVGGADVNEASGSAGARYNRWLAERRVGRVADWLKENAGGRRLEIGTSYAEDDPSRRVTVRLKAGG